MSDDVEFIVNRSDALAIAAKILIEMWRGTHFSICAVDKALTVMGLHRPHSYSEWGRLHCVDWNKMPRGMPEKLMASVVAEIARGSSMQVEFASANPALMLEKMEGR